MGEKTGHMTGLFLKALFCMMLLVGCYDRRASHLRVGAIVWPGYECLFLARSLGLYDSTQIKLVEYSSPREVIRALQNRAIEAAAMTSDEYLRLCQETPSLRVVLVTDISKGADALLARGARTNLVQLQGSRVGVEPNSVGAFLLTRALDSARLSIENIQIVPLSITEHVEAMQSGRVDAVATFEPHRSRLIDRGATVLYDSADIPGEIFNVLVVREELFRSNPKSLKSLIGGWFKARQFLVDEPEEASRRMASRERTTPEKFRASLLGMEIPSLEDNKQLLNSQTSVLLKRFDQIIQVMKRHELLETDFKAANFLDDRMVNSLP